MSEMKVYDLEDEEYQVTIAKEAYQKISLLGEEVSPNEVTGLLVCDVKDRKITIEDVLIPKQKVSSGWCLDDSKEIAKILEPLVRDDPELFAKIRGWWHSHGSINANSQAEKGI